LIGILAMTFVLSAAFVAGAATVIGTRHDLSSTGTRSIQSRLTGSGGTTEVCVFCHTPHSARSDAPLWNKADPTGPYTVYASDVLNALNITPESPVSGSAPGDAGHAKTRICMSYHDGTIALGSLVNQPSGQSGNIAMTGTDAQGRIPSTAMGYIGVDLRDDHPVAVKHRDAAHVDQELKSISGSKVRLYYASGNRILPTTADGNYIECTSCHDAHDNTYGKFLIDDNVGSKLCLSCHTKQGYASLLATESVHSNTTYSTAFSPPTGGIPATLGGSVETVKCMVCHYPHKSGVTIGSNSPNPGAGKYLLSYKEEQSCYNNPNRWGQTVSVCHGSLASSTKNIFTEVNKSSAHHVDTSTGLHNATEGRSGVLSWTTSEPGSGWHVECDDCHNTHSAGKLLHTNGTNTVISTYSIYGAGGVAVSWPVGGWNATFLASNFTYIQPLGVVELTGGVSYEYEICLKCHSSWGGSIPASMTDQAKEFNIYNASYHPVAALNAARFSPTQWTGGSGFNDNSLMFCSDCHGNNSISPQPQGPHGSVNTGLMVRPPNGATYGPANGGAAQQQSNGDLCFKCHSTAIYNTASNGSTSTNTGFRTAANLNLHNQHAFRSSPSTTIANPLAYRCVNCHTRTAHGWKRKALVVLRGDGSLESGWGNAYEAMGQGTGLIDSSTVLPAAGAYGPNRNDNCTTSAVTGCHN